MSDCNCIDEAYCECQICDQCRITRHPSLFWEHGDTICKDCMNDPAFEDYESYPKTKGQVVVTCPKR